MKKFVTPSDMLKPTMVRYEKEIFQCGDKKIFFNPLEGKWILYQGSRVLDKDQYCSDLCERNGFRLG